MQTYMRRRTESLLSSSRMHGRLRGYSQNIRDERSRRRSESMMLVGIKSMMRSKASKEMRVANPVAKHLKRCAELIIITVP